MRGWRSTLSPGRSGVPLRFSVALPPFLALACVVLKLARLAGLLEWAVAVVGCSVEGDDVILVCLVIVETLGLESIAV